MKMLATADVPATSSRSRKSSQYLDESSSTSVSQSCSSLGLPTSLRPKSRFTIVVVLKGVGRTDLFVGSFPITFRQIHFSTDFRVLVFNVRTTNKSAPSRPLYHDNWATPEHRRVVPVGLVANGTSYCAYLSKEHIPSNLFIIANRLQLSIVIRCQPIVILSLSIYFSSLSLVLYFVSFLYLSSVTVAFGLHATVHADALTWPQSVAWARSPCSATCPDSLKGFSKQTGHPLP